MKIEILYTLLSVIVVSMISLVAAIPLLAKKRTSQKTLFLLLSVSVGVLLGTVLLDFIPEIIEFGYTLGTAMYILLGFIVLFVVESVVHWHHSHGKHPHGHGHAYSLAPVNIVGDAVHNFIDGLVLAGAYSVNIVLGLTATISVIFHEVPQEIADMGVLLYAGLPKKKAVLYNLGAAVTAFIGAGVGLMLAGRVEGFSSFVIPFAAGNFLYIAAANLLPQLQNRKLEETIIHIAAILIGFAIIALITVYGPVHVHTA